MPNPEQHRSNWKIAAAAALSLTTLNGCTGEQVKTGIALGVGVPLGILLAAGSQPRTIVDQQRAYRRTVVQEQNNDFTGAQLRAAVNSGEAKEVDRSTGRPVKLIP